MALVKTALSFFSIIWATVLFVAAFDVGHIGLGKILSPLAIVFVLLFVICSIAPLFLGSGGGGAKDFDPEELTTKVAELQSKAFSKITALQTSVDGLTGQDNESLAEENRLLKEQLDAIHQAERDKVLNQAEELRMRNEELEAQIKQWAIDTVGDAVQTGEVDKEEDGSQATAA